MAKKALQIGGKTQEDSLGDYAPLDFPGGLVKALEAAVEKRLAYHYGLTASMLQAALTCAKRITPRWWKIDILSIGATSSTCFP